jgi:hypothetical protein
MQALLQVANRENSTQVLIHCYKAVAECISVTSSRSDNALTAELANDFIHRSRTVYRVLVGAAAVSNSRADAILADEDRDEQSGEASSNPLNIEIEGLDTDDEAKNRDLDDDESEDDDARDEHTSIEDAEVSSQPPEVPKAPKRRKSKWERLLCLPNFHVGLHLADNIREYGHIMNCNVLSGELTHRYVETSSGTAFTDYI